LIRTLNFLVRFGGSGKFYECPPMKKTIRPYIGLCSVILVFLYAPISSLAAAKTSIATKAPFSVNQNKTVNAKKHKIRLIGSGNDKVLCMVNGTRGKAYQVFVFTIDCKLVTHTSMRKGETTTLNNLSKGNYMVEVLADDEKVDSVALTIK
jgi:hypothetical protein